MYHWQPLNLFLHKSIDGSTVYSVGSVIGFYTVKTVDRTHQTCFQSTRTIIAYNHVVCRFFSQFHALRLYFSALAVIRYSNRFAYQWRAHKVLKRSWFLGIIIFTQYEITIIFFCLRLGTWTLFIWIFYLIKSKSLICPKRTFHFKFAVSRVDYPETRFVAILWNMG